MKQNKKNSKKIIYVIISVFLSILVILGVSGYLLASSGDYLVFKINKVSNLLSQVRQAEKTGGSIEIQEEDINGILEVYAKKINSNSSLKINGIYSKLSGQTLYVYIPISYEKFNAILSSKGELKSDGDKILFIPSVFKVGKIDLSRAYVMEKLKAYSRNDVTIDANSIYLAKSILPFDVLSLSVQESKIIAQIKKIEDPQNPAVNNANNTTQTASPQTRQDILKRANGQLGGVRNDAKTEGEKQIISQIQVVVGKMIQDPNYAYKVEADNVKSRYSSLSSAEKDDIKNAILMNMDMATLREIKTTFGI